MTRSQSPVLQRALSAHEGDPTSRTSAHLSTAAFRFGPEAPSPAAPRPVGPGARWSLADTLREARLRGARVVVTTLGLHVRHAHRMPEVAAAVRAHADAVRLWLDLGCPAPVTGWDDETALHHAWLRQRFGSPPMPVALRPGVSVADWPRFVARVDTALAEGPAGPTADAVRRDLGDLFAGHAQLKARPVVQRRHALAA